MADVFLSYSRLDRPVAEAISRALESRGWSVWWDRKIGAGDSFDKTIERELDSAKCVVVVWSKTSIDSDWVKNEAAAAVERKALVPVMIENIRLPIEFRRKQTIDLSGWDRTPTDTALVPLLESISERLSGAPPTFEATSAGATTRPRLRISRTAWLVSAVGGAALAVVAGVSLLHTDSTDYTLVCKGGGAFGIQSEGLFAARIGFSKAAGPASASLPAGQCAWTDRPVNDNEPAEMCYQGILAFGLSRKFAANELVRQQVHFEAENSCLRITNFL